MARRNVNAADVGAQPYMDALSGKGKKVDPDWLATAMRMRPATPEGTSGKISIVATLEPAGKSLTVVSFRNAIFMGQQATNMTFQEPLIYRALKSEKHGTWMTDSCQEVYQCRDAIEALPNGASLLVGGLGLGVYTELALRMANPRRVVTVEREPDVIKLVAPFVGIRDSRSEVEQEDIYKFAAKLGRGDFDFAMLDTWQSTGEYCWAHEVVPLRRLARPKIRTVWCWNEEEMWGQIEMAAFRKILQQREEISHCDLHMQVLRAAAERDGLIDPAMSLKKAMGDKVDIEKLLRFEAEQRKRPEIVALLSRLLRDAGSEAWEAEFGTLWDEALEYEKAESKRLDAKRSRLKRQLRKAKVST